MIFDVSVRRNDEGSMRLRFRVKSKRVWKEKEGRKKGM
jgi:hypothetical protein